MTRTKSKQKDRVSTRVAPKIGNRYLGLLFFTARPDSMELKASFELYNSRSKQGLISAALYLSANGFWHALLIIDAGHHLDPIMAIAGTTFAPAEILIGAELLSPRASTAPIPTGESLIGPVVARIIPWEDSNPTIMGEGMTGILAIASTLPASLKAINLCPTRPTSAGGQQSPVFYWSWSWRAAPEKMKAGVRPSYDALLSQITETFRSDVAYLLLRLKHVQSKLRTWRQGRGFERLLSNRIDGVLSAIDSRLSHVQERYDVVFSSAPREPDALAEADGVMELTEEVSGTLSVLDEIVHRRGNGDVSPHLSTSRIEDALHKAAFHAADNVVQDLAASLRGTYKVYGQTPGRVTKGGTAFQPLHDTLRPLIGQYDEVLWDEYISAHTSRYDLAERGVIECYEIPRRLILRMGSWPLFARSVVETNMMRMTETGQYRLLRVALDLFKWWAARRRAPVPGEFESLDQRIKTRPPSRTSPEGVIELHEIAHYPLFKSEESKREFVALYDALVDIVCTRVSGPAYVFALSRFGLRGNLARVKGRRKFYQLQRHESLKSDRFFRQTGMLVEPRERLSVCLSALGAADIQIPALSSLLSGEDLLESLDARILREIDGLIVRNPYDCASHEQVAKLTRILIGGRIIDARPILLLNTLWYAVYSGLPYLNELSLLRSLTEASVR